MSKIPILSPHCPVFPLRRHQQINSPQPPSALSLSLFLRPPLPLSPLTSLSPGMDKQETEASSSQHQEEDQQQEAAETLERNTTHHLTVPHGLTQDEFDSLKHVVAEFHSYRVNSGHCSSLLAQRINAPLRYVWSMVRRFDKPQTYKHFIKSCSVREDFRMAVGDTRDVNVISGLPAATSTERLDMLDDDRHVTGFSIIGGEHRLRNYRSVTTVHEFDRDGRIWTVVLESYIVDVPEGNTEEDTRLFADTVVRLNLQKLASATEAMSRDHHQAGGGISGGGSELGS